MRQGHGRGNKAGLSRIRREAEFRKPHDSAYDIRLVPEGLVPDLVSLQELALDVGARPLSPAGWAGLYSEVGTSSRFWYGQHKRPSAVDGLLL